MTDPVEIHGLDSLFFQFSPPAADASEGLVELFMAFASHPGFKLHLIDNVIQVAKDDPDRREIAEFLDSKRIAHSGKWSQTAALTVHVDRQHVLPRCVF